MENKRFLLTYKNDVHCEFSWFDTEEELREFAQDNILEDYEAIEIIQSREIEL